MTLYLVDFDCVSICCSLPSPHSQGFSMHIISYAHQRMSDWPSQEQVSDFPALCDFLCILSSLFFKALAFLSSSAHLISLANLPTCSHSPTQVKSQEPQRPARCGAQERTIIAIRSTQELVDKDLPPKLPYYSSGPVQPYPEMCWI